MEITQSSCFLSELLRQARQGQLLPASFQRPYVWSKKDVLALVHSIINGYPIGSFMTWTPWDKADLTKSGRGRLGPILGDLAKRDTSFLLDGQNRLASLAWMEHWPSAGFPWDLTESENAVWNDGTQLVVDLQSKCFMFVPVAEITKGLRLPVALFVANKGLSAYIRSAWDTHWKSYSNDEKDDCMPFVDVCSNAFGNARVTVTDISHASILEARDAFAHICRTGVPMTDSDFNNALAWALPE